MFNRTQKKIEKLLGSTIPFKTTGLYFSKWQPNPDLYYFHAYIKLDATKSQYLKLVKTLNLGHRGQTPEADSFLPASWNCQDEKALAWWHASAETPIDAAAERYGVNGWIAAKFENDAIYIHITDTGSEKGRPGPW